MLLALALSLPGPRSQQYLSQALCLVLNQEAPGHDLSVAAQGRDTEVNLVYIQAAGGAFFTIGDYLYH